MTTGTGVFWIYLTALSFMGGIPTLVLGLIARFTGRPFDTPRKFRLFLALLAVVGVLSLIISILSYSLGTYAGAPVSFRVNLLISPFLSYGVIFIWASGIPLSRILNLRS
jgi:hypothetical protein